MTVVVGVVFSPGGKVYSFDPVGLELAWNERVVCQTARGHELGRVVKGNYEVEESGRTQLKKVVRRATELDVEVWEANRVEAKQAMRVFREVIREQRASLKPVAAELVFDGSRYVFSYEADERPDVGALQAALRQRLHRRIELRSVGPRECARLCGRLRCCLAFEHPLYRSFRERAPRVGRRVETPRGVGLVTGYKVLEDACTVDLEGGDEGVALPVDDCRELARSG